jgi:fatty-acyl-CoA synthase
MTQIADMRRQSLSTMLRRSALRHGERVAIICGKTRWSYADLDRLADQLCDGLKTVGIIKGDRIAVMARNSHALWRYGLRLRARAPCWCQSISC